MTTTRVRCQDRAIGFTMVELIIVIMVMLILSAIAAPSLSRLMKQSKVQQAAKVVVAALYDVRVQAQRHRTTVAVFYGDDPSRLKALWTPPLSTTLPKKNQIEIWTVGNTMSVNNIILGDKSNIWSEDGLNSGSVIPSNPAGPTTNAVWFPFYDKKTSLLEVPYVVPDGVRILAGDFNSNTGDFDFGNMAATPVGEIKRHYNVLTRNGMVPTYANTYCYRWVLVYDTVTGDHLVIEVGDWKSSARPRILDERIKSVTGVALTDPRQLDKKLN